jgi:15-cis-phytoene synthase
MDVGPQLADMLRGADRDRYLSTLYAPPDKRAALSALYAFNAEVASVRDKVREPMAGEVRLQWWRDAIAEGEASRTGSPVTDALNATIGAHRLPVSAFERLLEARIFDLYDDPMPDRAALEGYCGETASTLIQLACLILDSDAAPDWADAAGHAGCAQAITGLLRVLPLHRARGQCFLPADILASSGISSAELIGGENPSGSARAIEATVALAREHWNAFGNHAKGLPQPLRPAFLPLAPVPAYLKAVAANPAKALERIPDTWLPRVQLLFVYRAMRGW